MNRTSIPISEIQVINRQRFDLGDIDNLARSLNINGLIQPIVINQDKRLIAGGRRLQAAILLEWKNIDVVYRETMSEDELHILELEENIQRKDQTWQEKCLHIQTIHQIKVRTEALDLVSWGQRETGVMLGVSVGNINYNLTIANLLRSELDANNKPIEGARYWTCDSLSAAWKLWLRDKEDKLLAELAARAQAAVNDTIVSNPDVELDKLVESFSVDVVPGDTNIVEDEHIINLRARARGNYLSLNEQEAKTLYLANALNPPEQFEEYYKAKRAWLQQAKDTVYLSTRLINKDSIAFMNDPDNSGRFDHVITDIPYGINVSMMNQQGQQMVDIDTIEELHDVDYNRQLIQDFFPAAYHCTKDQCYVITWCDQMLWQFMYDCAIKTGFAVQRWPITWIKTSACLNQCAQFNTTKDTEIAIVCRKKGTTLVKQPHTSTISTGRDALCSAIGHPFAKPAEIWYFLLDTFTLEGQSILEPFAGRGSGVISMLKKNRHVVGVELDINHYNALYENVKSMYYLPLNPNFQFK